MCNDLMRQCLQLAVLAGAQAYVLAVKLAQSYIRLHHLAGNGRFHRTAQHLCSHHGKHQMFTRL
jgi:hypothetical protein